MELTLCEKELIENIRRIGFGELTIQIQKGEPVVIKEGFKQIKLGVLKT